MSLILAIEPDRRRAAQLTGMARAHLRAELLVAATASQAVDGLDGRVPDILLTAPLLPSQEEAAIADYLRQLGSAAAHVQTLTIPLLANGSGEDDRPVLSAFLRDRVRRTETEGCDPSVFAEQITEYLREARERREVPPPIAPVVQSEVTPPPVQPAKAKKGVMAQLLLAAAAEERVDDFLEFVVETPERPDQASVNPAPSRREAAEPELIATYRREPATAAESQEDDAPEMQSEWMSGTAAQIRVRIDAGDPRVGRASRTSGAGRRHSGPRRASDAGGQCRGGRLGQRCGRRQHGDAAAVDTSAQGAAGPG